MIRFRPLKAPTLIALPMLAVCVGLGVWQVQRLDWKSDLIARMETRLQRPPAPLGMAMSESDPDPDPLEWRRVSVRGRFLHAKEMYLFARGPNGATGVHVITPFQWENHGVLLIDRGFVPDAKRDLSTRARAQTAGEVEVTGIVRNSTAPGLFTPGPDPVRRLWFARSAEQMAREARIRLVVPFFIEADATPNPGGYPIGGQTIVDIPNNHLSYAITWFALALALVGVYLAYHAKQGRLTLGRK